MSGSTDEPVKKDEAKQGLWGLLAQQAKVMLDENGSTEDVRNQPPASSGSIQPSQSRWSYDRVRKSESPTFQKSEAVKLDIGGKIKNALEEGLTTMGENRTGVVGRKLQIRRKACSLDMRSTNMNLASADMSSPMLTDMESPQIKASRDVASAMAAKAKLLQREMKTLKADLAFSKERCAQLEEENRLLRDGNHDADEDLIRRQLETLLAEKARLANENTVYARVNRFLREIVEFHQLNDVVSLNEDIEEEDEGEDADDGADRPCDDPGTPATPGTAPQTPCHADEVPTPGTHSGNAVDVAESPVHRSLKEDSDVVTGSSLRRSSKDNDGSPETPPPVRPSFVNDGSCSPEMPSDD